MSDDRPEETPTQPKSGLISKVLAPAIRLWLKSQTQQLDDLKLSIQAGDRQLLSGQIPKVAVSAASAIYQGIHISQLQLTGSNIQINLSQVMRGKALKLLAAFPIDIEMVLSEENLNQSLTAPIVCDAVSTFLLNLLGRDQNQESLTITNLHSQLQNDTLLLCGSLPANSSGESTEIAIRTGIQLTQPNEIQLQNPVWLPHANAKRGMAIAELNGYSFDLGPETRLSSVQLDAGQISCTGQLMVLP
jgi:LmeA-like phospholipid-binding